MQPAFALVRALRNNFVKICRFDARCYALRDFFDQNLDELCCVVDVEHITRLDSIARFERPAIPLDAPMFERFVGFGPPLREPGDL